MEDIDQKYYCSNYYDVSVNKFGFEIGTSLRFWENNRWINKIDPYGWFQWYFRYWLGRRSFDDERQIIKDAGGTFDDNSVSPKIRQILLHWGNELTDDIFFINSTN